MWQHGYHYSAQVLGCGPDDQGCLLFFTATSVEDHMHDLSPHPSRKPPVMAEEPHQGMDRRGFLTSFSLTRFSEAALGRVFWTGQAAKPDPDRGHLYRPVEDRGTLVVAGRDRSVLLEQVDRPLHRVAVPVGHPVKGRGPATGRTFTAAVLTLVPGLGDARLDTAPAQMGSGGSAGVSLVRQEPIRAGTRPTHGAWQSQVGHQGGEHTRIPALPRAGGQDKRALMLIGDQVDLGGQPTSGASQRLTPVRFVPDCVPFFTAPAACW